MTLFSPASTHFPPLVPPSTVVVVVIVVQIDQASYMCSKLLTEPAECFSKLAVPTTSLGADTNGTRNVPQFSTPGAGTVSLLC